MWGLRKRLRVYGMCMAFLLRRTALSSTKHARQKPKCISAILSKPDFNSIQHSVVTCALHADLGREEVMDDRHRLTAVAVLFIGSFTIEREKHISMESL